MPDRRQPPSAPLPGGGQGRKPPPIPKGPIKAARKKIDEEAQTRIHKATQPAPPRIDDDQMTVRKVAPKPAAPSAGGQRYRTAGMRWTHPLGQVFNAVDGETSDRVVVTLLHPAKGLTDAHVDASRAAANVLAGLVKPYINGIVDVVRYPDNRLAIVTEYINASALSEQIGKKVLPPPRVIAILRQVCRALGDAHRAGVAHGALNAASVLLTGSQGRPDSVVVTDFALQGIVDAALDIPTVGAALQPVSPERILGLPRSEKEDIYLVGCLGYVMLTGGPPFRTGSAHAVQRRHAIEDPMPIEERLRSARLPPPALTAVIHRCLAKEQDERFADMADLEAELCLAQIDAGISTPWDDLPLPHVEDDRKQRILTGLQRAGRGKPADAGAPMIVETAPSRPISVDDLRTVATRRPVAPTPKPKVAAPPPKVAPAPPKVAPTPPKEPPGLPQAFPITAMESSDSGPIGTGDDEPTDRSAPLSTEELKTIVAKTPSTEELKTIVAKTPSTEELKTIVAKTPSAPAKPAARLAPPIVSAPAPPVTKRPTPMAGTLTRLPSPSKVATQPIVPPTKPIVAPPVVARPTASVPKPASTVGASPKPTVTTTLVAPVVEPTPAAPTAVKEPTPQPETRKPTSTVVVATIAPAPPPPEPEVPPAPPVEAAPALEQPAAAEDDALARLPPPPAPKAPAPAPLPIARAPLPIVQAPAPLPIAQAPAALPIAQAPAPLPIAQAPADTSSPFDGPAPAPPIEPSVPPVSFPASDPWAASADAYDDVDFAPPRRPWALYAIIVAASLFVGFIVTRLLSGDDDAPPPAKTATETKTPPPPPSPAQPEPRPAPTPAPEAVDPAPTPPTEPVVQPTTKPTRSGKKTPRSTTPRAPVTDDGEDEPAAESGRSGGAGDLFAEGNRAFNSGNYSKAESLLSAAVKQAPGNSKYRLSLGDALFKQGKYQIARIHYVKARELGHPSAGRRIESVDAKLGG